MLSINSVIYVKKSPGHYLLQLGLDIY